MGTTNFLLSEKSKSQNLGPSRRSRPELPNVYKAGLANAAGLNHCASVGVETAGEPIRFANRLPLSAGLEVLANTVNGNPVLAVKLSESLHPPITALTIPPWFR